jgi:FKBP-type peptidyl-prolyl cis-trans isomerase
MKQIFLALLVILSLSACNNASKTNSELTDQKIDSQNQEVVSDWLTNLYKNYKESPVTQAELDENLLIDYIADREIPVERSNTGLYYQIITPGEGELLKMGDAVKAHYKGYYLDGHVFDSSISRGKPLNFKVGQMIAGWNEGLLLLRKGAKAKLLIPSRLAYGKKGFPGFVDPNKALVFELEIL